MRAFALALFALSFELKLDEIKLCLDCFNRVRLDLSVFVCSCIELFNSVHDDNYPVQMELPGL